RRLNCPLPSLRQIFPNAWVHFRMKALITFPMLCYLLLVFTITHGQACHASRTEGGSFGYMWPYDGGRQDIALKLHQQIICGCATVYPKLRDFHFGVILHSLQHVHGLIGDAFEGGSRNMSGAAASREAHEGTTCVLVPVRGTKPRER